MLQTAVICELLRAAAICDLLRAAGRQLMHAANCCELLLLLRAATAASCCELLQAVSCELKG